MDSSGEVYTDNKGIEYALEYGFETGDIAILSDGEVKMAWRIDRGVLASASSVFRDMLTIDSSSKEIHLPESGSDLRLFFRALVPTAKCVPPHGPEFIEADYLDLIGLLIKYDCATIARSELYNLVKITRADLFFDWFVLASRLNSIESACRLLVQGWKSFRSHKGPLQIPTSTPLCFIHESRWAPEETKQINPEWVGALAYASMTVQHQINPGRSA